jgi:hypothetical protein
MSAVDRTDMPLSYMFSAHALYLMQKEKHMPLPDFQMSVIRGLLQKHKEYTELLGFRTPSIIPILK